MPCQLRSWKARSSICGCSSITASGWSASVSHSTTPAMASARHLARAATDGQFAVYGNLARASPGSSRAPSRRCACASPLTSCAVCASSSRRSRRSRPRSHVSSPRSPRQLLCEPGFGPPASGDSVFECPRGSSTCTRVRSWLRSPERSPGNAPRARHTRLGGPTTLRNCELLEACDHARVHGKASRPHSVARRCRVDGPHELVELGARGRARRTVRLDHV